MNRVILETKIFTNPAELRRIANEMEKEISDVCVGEGLVKYEIVNNSPNVIYLMWDQEN